MTKSLNTIFILKSPNNSNFLGEYHSSVSFNTINCLKKPGHQRAGKRVGQLSISLPERAMKHSFAWTWYSDFLVSETVIRKFISSSLTGFETQPVEVWRKGVLIDHDFKQLIITGWGGIARKESGVRLLEECPACGFLRYSAVTNWQELIDWNMWDGSDFFMVWPLPRFIFITEKASSIIQQLNKDSVQIIPISEMESQNDELTPGRLSYWYPESKIKDLKIDSTIY